MSVEIHAGVVWREPVVKPLQHDVADPAMGALHHESVGVLSAASLADPIGSVTKICRFSVIRSQTSPDEVSQRFSVSNPGKRNSQ